MEKKSNAAPNAVAPASTDKPKKSMKGLLIALICGGILVIGAAVAVTLLLVSNSGITRKDYREAQEQVQSLANGIVKDYEAFIGRMPQSLGDAKEKMHFDEYDSFSDFFDNYYTKEVKKMQSKINNKLTEIGKLKAIKGDEEAAAKFARLQRAVKEFNKEIETALNLTNVFIGKVGPLMDEYLAAANDGDIDTMVARLLEVADIFETTEIGDMRGEKLFGDMANLFRELATNLTNYANGTMSDEDIVAFMTEYERKYNKLIAELSELQTTGSRSNPLSKAINSLDKYLTSKARGAR
ncbi:hypothetical protein FWF74_03660 [Candidatus Saccharibacteria bacterium]|nr:hypothetical protein [Candidatus Saccharibacteria bacterium]MCL1962871.1 hypothetical protein [Candidatus Saccharibacteria bacterium]